MNIAYMSSGGSLEIHRAEDKPVAVILTAEDRDNIARMAPDATVYMAYPDAFQTKDAQALIDRICDEAKR